MVACFIYHGNVFTDHCIAVDDFSCHSIWGLSESSWTWRTVAMLIYSVSYTVKQEVS
jgi:hypothetical protein